MIYKIVILITIIISLFGCKPEKQEVINLSDIIPESENYKEGQNKGDSSNAADTLLWVKDQFTRNGIAVDSVESHKENYFPDRFGPSSVEKYKLISKTDTVLYLKWNYADSMKTMNAFFNWIDCFGKNCRSMFVGEESNFQRNSMQILVNDTSLIFIEAVNSIDFKKWSEYHEAIGYALDWNYIIEQRKRGRAQWFTFEEEKKIPYKK